MFIGVLMHLSGMAHALSLVTGAIRSLLRLKRLISPENVNRSFQISLSTVSSLLPQGVTRLFPIIHYLQEQLSAIITHFDNHCPPHLLPVPTGLGFLYGCFFVYGSKVGMYHSLFLPAILLEMDSAGGVGEEASLLGAIDECTLAMVCAGICAANLTLPMRSKQSNAVTGKNAKRKGGGQASLSWQALKTNLLCGDFIEAAYPSGAIECTQRICALY